MQKKVYRNQAVALFWENLYVKAFDTVLEDIKKNSNIKQTVKTDFWYLVCCLFYQCNSVLLVYKQSVQIES